jgi:hypothetical protein
LAGLRRPGARHDPGRVLVDLAVAVADGATTISDIAVLGDQAELFGAVASDSTCWRLLDQLDSAAVGRVARARAVPGSWCELNALRPPDSRSRPRRRADGNCRVW